VLYCTPVREPSFAVNLPAMRRLGLTVALVLLASACGSTDRYELVSSSYPGAVYRLDRSTGEVVLINIAPTLQDASGTPRTQRVLAPGECRRLEIEERLQSGGEKGLPGVPRSCDNSW